VPHTEESETVSDLPQNGEQVGALGMTPSKLRAGFAALLSP